MSADLLSCWQGGFRHCLVHGLWHQVLHFAELNETGKICITESWHCWWATTCCSTSGLTGCPRSGSMHVLACTVMLQVDSLGGSCTKCRHTAAGALRAGSAYLTG